MTHLFFGKPLAINFSFISCVQQQANMQPSTRIIVSFWCFWVEKILTQTQKVQASSFRVHQTQKK